MSTLFWPGDDALGPPFDDVHLASAMVRVEFAWLETLAAAGIARDVEPRSLERALRAGDPEDLATDAVAGGNPVIGLLALLRERLTAAGHEPSARWLHRGLTSQDTLDTGLVLLARDTARGLAGPLGALVRDLVRLAGDHRATSMSGRTLTQPAVPIRFGAKVAGWLQGVLDAADDVDRLTFPAQVGGAAGTLSGVVVLTGGDAARALDLATTLAGRLDLAARSPWHTDRAPVTRIGEAFARVTAACGRIANDVLTLGRPEIGELSEPSRGGSSTMPQKSNPVLSTLVRRNALTAPAQLSLLHLAAADTGDERPAGAWHLEWQPLQQLARHAVTSVSHTATVVAGLGVETARMAANLTAAGGIEGEQLALGALVAPLAPEVWAGADDPLIDAALARATAWLGVDR